MATSTIPAFQAALKAALVALTVPSGSLDGVLVVNGPPDSGQAAMREIIQMGDNHGSEHAAALGRQRREESYISDVYVVVSMVGQVDHDAVDARAFALLAVIENVLRADATLGNVVRWAQFGGVTDHVKGISPNGNERVTGITGAISVSQRI